MAHNSSFRAFAALTASVAVVAFAGVSRAQKTPEPGFVPNTGQINRGTNPKLPSISKAAPVPSQQEARAALLQADSPNPSTGANPPNAPANAQQQATTGTGASGNTTTSPTASGPIASTTQTIPAKFSKRNDTLDRVPTMAWPLRLDDQQRKQLYQAVMADNTQPAAGAEKLTASQAITYAQSKQLRPLPPSAQGIPGLKGLAYLKTKDKVLLVRPEVRTVVDEISAS